MIYSHTLKMSPGQYAYPEVRSNAERICREIIEAKTGCKPEPGAWVFHPEHEGTWENPDTGEEETHLFRAMWHYTAEVEVPDDWADPENPWARDE